MVATRLSEVMYKGIEWAYGGNSNNSNTLAASSSNPNLPSATSWTTASSSPDLKLLQQQQPSQQQQQQQQHQPSEPKPQSSWFSWSTFSPEDSYWNYTSDTLTKATEPIYSNMENVIKYFYPASSSSTTLPMLQTMESHEDNGLGLGQQQQQHAQKRRYNSSMSKYSELTWMLKNPNLGVRGRGGNPSAVPAVRSLLVAVDQLKQQQQPSAPAPSMPLQDAPPNEKEDACHPVVSESDLPLTDEQPLFPKPLEQQQQRQQSTASSYIPGDDDTDHDMMYESWTGGTTTEDSHHNHKKNKKKKKPVSSSETASLLAEGTLRSLRDFALDEAVELNGALQYWAMRWEMPLLSWLEAGPAVWFSKQGYKHQEVGRKVSQIQAVLARRCSAIGQLQQHLLRAGWQRGVAQWGVLGQGGRWAAVAAFNEDDDVVDHEEANAVVGHYHSNAMDSTSQSHHRLSSEISETSQSMLQPDTTTEREGGGGGDDDAMGDPVVMSNISNFPHPSPSKAANFSYYGHGNVFVRNTHGGMIVTDDPAWAEWSVDAVRLIRIHLDRAANGFVRLPYADNWREEELIVTSSSSHEVEPQGQLISPAPLDPTHTSSRPLPRWARLEPPPIATTTEAATDITEESPPEVKEAPASPPVPPPSKMYISDLKLLADEISEILTAMEYIMEMQRSRRLDKLKPMGWLRRNWYFAAGMTPVVAYLTKTLMNNNYGKELAIFLLDKLAGFLQEHVTGPLIAIWDQLFRGRATISDRKALEVANQTLKAMILTWLNENHREMPEAERKAKAQAMDVTWIDKTKEESMKSVLEGVNVVRMSFIQMQFIYKEVLNALVAMDDIIESNWINMNLAAVTPAILALYGVQWVSRVLYYVLLKLGRTREETFTTFRQVILDIERLLVMRDNPPFAPPPLHWGDGSGAYQQPEVPTRRCDTLSPDDLGMLMLHIHECRTILWNDRRRFSSATIRNVAEDLAELAGERGAVSVQQQLLIVSRMCRTYPFLKVLSAGTPFQLSAVHTQAV